MPERIGLVAELDLSQFDRAVNSYIRSVNRMERATTNVADNMLVAYARLGGVIATTVGGITAAVGGLTAVGSKVAFDWLEEGIEDATNFEQQMAEIAAVLVKTRSEVEPLAQLINTIALDPQLVVSAEEAGAMVEQLSRNGVEMTDVINGAARASILLANATGGDFAMAADVATMAMHMFNMEASNLNRIADISQQIINSSRIELDDWKLAMGNGGAIAASFGIDLENFAAAIEVTVNSYHSARQAGTGFMNFIQRLVPITKEAGDEFKKLGLFTGLTDEEFQRISTEIAETEQRIADLDPRLVHYDELVQAHTQHATDLRKELVRGKNAFFDEKGEMYDLGKVSNILIEATKDLTTEQRASAFRTIFGNDAAETAVKLATMNINELKELADTYRKTGQAEAAAASRTDTLAKRWENLQDIWDSIRRLSGAKFIDMLDNLVKKMTALTNQNQERVVEFFGRMAELLDRIVDAAMPWVERMLPVLIDNTESLAYWLVELALGGNRASEWFAKMHPNLQKFLNRVMEIIAMGRRFLTWLREAGKAIAEVLRPFTDWVRENVTLKDALIAAGGAVVAFLGPLAILIARMAIVGVAAAKAVSFIRRAWTSDLNNIRTIFTSVWKRIQEPLFSFVNNFLMGRWVDAWDDAVDVVTNALGVIERYLPDFFKPFTRFITAMLQGQWGQAWDHFIDIVRNVFEAIKLGLEKLSHPFTDFILRILQGRWMDAWRIFQKTAVNVLRYLTARLPEFFKPLGNFITSILEGRWEDAWEHAKQMALNVYKAIISGLDRIGTPFTRFISNILQGKWRAAWRQVVNFAIGAFDFIKKELRDLGLPFTNFIANILEGKWGDAWGQVKNVALFAYNWILDQLRSFGNRFAQLALSLLTGAWKNAWAIIQNIATDVLIWLRDNTPAIFRSLFESLIALIHGQWDEAWRNARIFVVEVLEEIRDYFGSDWISDLMDILINFVEGDWEGMWYMMRASAITALGWLRDNFVPEILDPLMNMLINLIEGDWADAWEDARKFVEGVKDWIVEWLDGFDSPFTSFFARVLEGEWKLAWEEALKSVDLVKQAIIDWLENKGPWASFASSILQGDWKSAWDQAKDLLFGTEGVFTKIELWLTGSTKWSEFAKLILEGEFGKAWDTLETNIFGEEGFAKKLDDWLTDMGPWGTFATNLLGGDFGLAWSTLYDILWASPDGIFYKLDQWLIANPGPWSDFARDVLRGDWIKAWDDLKIAVGLTDDVVETFKSTIYTLIGAFALAIATMISFQVRGLLGIVKSIGMLAGTIFKFIPVIGAIALAVAMLRVAWEEDFMGIQEATKSALRFIVDTVIIGLTVAGNIVDLFLAVMREDWNAAWQEIVDIGRLAWIAIANVSLAALSMIEGFMVDGPGKDILSWLAVTFPQTVLGLENVFRTSTQVISMLWRELTEQLGETKFQWGEIFGFIDAVIGTSISRISSFVGVVGGVIDFVINAAQTISGVNDELAARAEQFALESKGDTAGAEAAKARADAARTASDANRQLGIEGLRTAIQRWQEPLIETWNIESENAKQKAIEAAENAAQNIIDATRAGQRILSESLGDSEPLTKEVMESRFLPQMQAILSVFNSLNTVLQTAETREDAWIAARAQLQGFLDDMLFPDGEISPDLSRPTAIYTKILDAIKGLGVDITGDFLNEVSENGTSVADILREKLMGEDEADNVAGIFARIMGEVTGLAQGFVSQFKSIGEAIGASLGTGMADEPAKEEVRNAASDLIQAAIAQIEADAEISSPSKVFMQLGYQSALGYAMGWKMGLVELQAFLHSSLSDLNTALTKAAFGGERLQSMLGPAGPGSSLLVDPLTMRDAVDAIQNQMSASTRRQLSQAMFGSGSRSSGNYLTNSNTTNQFGPVYLSHKMDEAEFLHRVEQIMDRRRPL